MPERFKVVCIPCKALYKCSALLLLLLLPLTKVGSEPHDPLLDAPLIVADLFNVGYVLAVDPA